MFAVTYGSDAVLYVIVKDQPTPTLEEPIDPAEVANSQDTATALAASAKRKSAATPIRRTFVQRSDKVAQADGAPLADLVRRRDRRGLILYLMVITLASTEPWNVSRDARIWARLLDLSEDKAGRATVSKVIRRLRDLNLVDSKRRGRKADLTLLLEDGSGASYTYPEPKDNEYYLKLPHAFWDNGWYRELDTPGLAMLLILLAEKDGARLPIDQIPKWYGISRATAQRGFRELAGHQLITTWDQQRKAPLTPEGYTYDRYYRLTGDFKRTPPKKTPTASKTTRPAAKGLAAQAREPKDTKPTGSKRRRDRRKKTSTNRKEAPT